MKFKGISSTPAAFVLIDITALRTSSSETETGSTKTNPVLNDGLVKKKKITEPLHINAVKPLETIDDAKSTQIIVQFLRR
jgi:hypothetical protein